MTVCAFGIRGDHGSKQTLKTYIFNILVTVQVMTKQENSLQFMKISNKFTVCLCSLLPFHFILCF